MWGIEPSTAKHHSFAGLPANWPAIVAPENYQRFDYNQRLTIDRFYDFKLKREWHIDS